MVHDVFISYSTKDKVTADAICHILEENKIKCWIAPRNITSGRDYADEIVNAIISTQVVVLVFSSNSQASQFVSNEINLSFTNSKPILSFKIDQSMPEREFEYFLKTNHWLDAYPEPEKVFDTLIRDVSRLLGYENSNPIIDSNVMAKAKSGKFNQISIKNEWKTFILLFTPLYPFVLIYMGLSAKMTKLTYDGILCIIPELLYLLWKFSGMFSYREATVTSYFIILLWIMMVVYVLFIKKDYLFRKLVINSVNDDVDLFNALIEEYGDVSYE